MIERVCEYCQNPYMTYPSIRLRFCSRRCAYDARRRGTTVLCPECGAPVYRFASTPEKKYCSISCAISARNKTDANPAYHRDITGENNPMYGVQRLGADNPMYGKRRDKCSHWKGGRKTRKDGYVVAAVPDDYPNPCDSSHNGVSYALEHRVVMEQHLGRYLEATEVVHHIDGNPSNNAIENLQLFASKSDHTKHHRASSLPSPTD